MHTSLNQCERCERPAIDGEALCAECEQNRAEAAHERSQEEGFRGTEAAGFLAEQQEAARKLK